VQKLNIVEIIWHDLGDWLSCYDKNEVISPNLHNLAKQGALFENSFCTAPQCSPSRGAIKTGMYPQSNGMLELTHRGGKYHDFVKDTPQIFNNFGYKSYLLGYQHERLEAKEFTYTESWIDSKKAPEVAVKAESFFRERATDKTPFFASIGFSHVHRPFGSTYSQEIADQLNVPGYLPDLPIVRKDIATFIECIRVADEAVGKILRAIEINGLEDSTLIYFSTDHGPEFPKAKMTLYDPGIKTALIMRNPSFIKAGLRFKELISNVDILPTILEASGLDIPKHIQGKSFWKLLTDQEYEQNTEVYAQMSWHAGEYDPMRCIRTQRYKYIKNFLPGWPNQMGGCYVQRYGEDIIEKEFSSVRKGEELYDLEVDPLEQNNLAYKRKFSKLKNKFAMDLEAFMKKIGDPLIQGHIPRAKSETIPCGCVWGKFPTHNPRHEKYQLKIVRTMDYNEYPI